jgi:hypothetical protein
VWEKSLDAKIVKIVICDEEEYMKKSEILKRNSINKDAGKMPAFRSNFILQKILKNVIK